MTRTLCYAVMVLLVVTGEARGQGFIIPDLGSRVNGMGAAVGRPDDLSAIYHNPAALALLPGTQLGVSFGAVFLNTDIRLRPWPGSDKFITDPVDSQGYYPRQQPGVFAPLPFIGASTKLGSDKLAGAVGIYIPNPAGATFGADAPSRYHIIDAYLFSAFFTAALAYRPWPWLAVGVGGSAVYVKVHRRQHFYPVLHGLDVSALIGTRTGLELDGSDVRPAFSLGVQAWPHHTVSLGFMMLSRHDLNLEGPLRLKLDPKSAMTSDPSLTENEQRTEMVAPWIFGFGANWDITRWLEVGAEIRLYLNSAYQEQITVITRGEVLKQLLPAIPGRPDEHGLVTPKHLHDSYHVGGGFKIRPPLGRIDLDLMLGVTYDNAASPANTVEVSAPSFDLCALHTGARWRINERFRVALLYTHYWYLQRTTKDSLTSPPTNFTGSAYSNILSVVLEARLGRGIGVR